MATTADELNFPSKTRVGLAYPAGDRRDLRIDFLRGMVMFLLIIVHIEIVSVYNLLVWERIGVVSGGEGFVILSGVVIGMVYGPRFMSGKAEAATTSLVNRSLQLYRVNLAMIIIAAALMILPWVDASSITTFTNRGSGEVFPLMPAVDASFKDWVSRVALLRVGPHQFQIMGLYVFLLLITPIAMWMISKGWLSLVLTIAWVLYIYNWVSPQRITGAQFEYGFPLLTWQLTYLHGVAIGMYRDRIAEIMKDNRIRRLLLLVSGILVVGFMFFAQNNPNSRLPEWAHISVIPAETFYKYYGLYFKKNSLGILRILNYTVVLIVAYYVLTRYWRVFERAFGWFFIPLGQASLYAFFMHVFFVLLIDRIELFQRGDWLWNSVAHTIALMGIWLMVRQQFLFRWVPR